MKFWVGVLYHDYPCHEGCTFDFRGAKFLERYRFDVFVFVLS